MYRNTMHIIEDT